MKTSELTAETHNKNEKNKAILVQYSNHILDTYQGNILFDELCKDDFTSYLDRKLATPRRFSKSQKSKVY